MKELFEKQEKDSFSDDYEAGYENFKNHFENYAEENGHELALKVAMDMSFRDDESEFSMGFNNAIIDITGRTHEMSEYNQFQEDPYLMGKFAALQDLAEMIDEGASYNDCLQAVQGTLNRELEKEASEYTDYESAVELGIESACFTFLKEASEFMADYEIAGADENDVALAIFEGVSEEFAKNAGLRDRARAAMGRAKDKITGSEAYGKAKKSLGKAKESLGKTFGKVDNADLEEARNRAGERILSANSKAGTRHFGAGVDAKRVAGAAALGLGGAAAAGYGAKKGYDHYKGKEQEKKAELNEVEQALMILEANGYDIEVGE